MPRIYLAGPMSGIRQFNFPAFDLAATVLRKAGYDVVSPAELDSPELREIAMASETGDMAEMTAKTGETWGDFLARDVKLIADGGIEEVWVLPFWWRSRGARLETFVAHLCGLKIRSYRSEQLISLSELRTAWAHGF